MSAVALDWQHRWRPKLQDLCLRLHSPPQLPSAYVLDYLRHSVELIPGVIQSTYYSTPLLSSFPLPSHKTATTNSAYLTPTSLIPPRTFVSPLRVHNPLVVKERDTLPCKSPSPCPVLVPRMHAQTTSGNLAVSTIEDIVQPRKLSFLPPESAATLSRSEISASFHTPNTTTVTTTVSSQAGELTKLCSKSATATPMANPCVSSVTNGNSTLQDDHTRNCKHFAKSGGPRGCAGAKNKIGGSVCCPRRRLTDDEGYIRRAACICVNKEETKVLLVSSKKDPCVWLVPGGGLEAGEEPTTAAKREAWEEAGIQGHIARYLGLFESYHHTGAKKHRTAVYIFVVTEEHADFPEARLGRRRQWFSMEDALLHLSHHRPLQSAYLQLMMMSRLKVAAAS